MLLLLLPKVAFFSKPPNSYLYFMKINNEILSSIEVLVHQKVKYNTMPKWVRFADILLTIVYLVGYGTILTLIVLWLIK